MIAELYAELRRLASVKLKKLPPGQTLQATALVHEVYLRLSREPSQRWDNRDGRRLLTLDADQGLSSWDPGSRQKTQVWTASNTNQMTAWTASLDGSTLAVASSDGTVEFSDLDKGTHSSSQLAPAGQFISALALSPNSRMLLFARQTSSLVLSATRRRTGPVGMCQLIPAPNPTVHLLDRVSDQRTELPMGVRPPFAFSPDGSTLATGGAGFGIQIWDAKEHRLLATLPGHTWAINAFAFAPDGALLASASDDNTLSDR